MTVLRGGHEKLPFWTKLLIYLSTRTAIDSHSTHVSAQVENSGGRTLFSEGNQARKELTFTLEQILGEPDIYSVCDTTPSSCLKGPERLLQVPRRRASASQKSWRKTPFSARKEFTSTLDTSRVHSTMPWRAKRSVPQRRLHVWEAV